MRLRKTTISNESLYNKERVIPYVEFQSTLLKIMKYVHRHHLSIKAAFIKLKNYNNFFKTAGANTSRMTFKWPWHGDIREVTAMYMFTNENPQIEFVWQNKKFLTLSMSNKETIEAYLHEDSENKHSWNDGDIKELVETFNQVLQARNIIYKSESRQYVTYAYQDHVTRFNKNEFKNIISQNENNNLTSRIENTIIKHAKRSDEKYSFYLDWPDSLQNNHLLKITFSRIDSFHKKYSWIIDELTLLNKFSSEETIFPHQRYYSFQVKEVLNASETAESSERTKPASKNEIEILSIWLAVDGLVGELKDLKKGKYLSGNNVLAIYDYFDRLFKIKHTLICDESRLADEQNMNRIPLRLISSLCTGKTWYQNKLSGVKLFECKRFKSAHNGFMTQSVEKRDHALKELQQLPLNDWYEMLDDKGKVMLIKLFDHPYDKDIFTVTTLKELTITLFNEAKEKCLMTPRLVEFINLLCGEIHKDQTLKPNKKQADFWLKSRIREILWGGYFWVKEANIESGIEGTSLPRII